MPGPWITNAHLRTLVADTMATIETELPGRWEDFIDRGNTSAAADIRSILSGRGFTDDQIDSWDRRIEFNEDLGLWYALARALQNSGSDNPDRYKNLDRRKELEKVAITVDGVIVIPGAGGGYGPDGTPIDGGGSVSGGRFDQSTFQSTNIHTVF